MKKIFIYYLIFFLMPINASNSYYKFGKQNASYNSFGESGLIVLPSAEIKDAGSIYFSLSTNDVYKYGALTVSPFSWLEASYFYYRPRDLYWSGPATKGQYLDKGFSVKFNHKVTNNFDLAIGLSDFAGTGFFTREYIVGTIKHDNYKLTGGVGFGKFADRDGFKNPFAFIDKRFENRSNNVSSNYKEGGSPSYDQWFRGNANFIFGGEFFLPGILKNTSLKIDYDPFDYIFGFSNFRLKQGTDFDLRKKDSNINFGFNHQLSENFNIGIYYIKGNTLNFTFSFGGNFSKPFFSKKLPQATSLDSGKGQSFKESFYEDLIYNINRQNIYLQSAEIKNNNIRVAVSSSKYRNPMHVHAILGDTVYALNEKNELTLDTLSTVGINVGHELQEITTPIELFKDRKDSIVEIVARESNLASGLGTDYSSHEFRPIIRYPASFTALTPALINHIGDPARFYHGGLVISLKNEIQFSSKLQLNTLIRKNLVDNFDEKRNVPDSRLPHVRTDIVSYLQQSDAYITRMQLDYFFSPYKEVFGKFSAGILENMYLGGGVEVLYKPFNRNFSIGFDAYDVKKRAFDRKFDTLNYKISTGHINFNYHLAQWGILGTLSFGKYLAGDTGYTFDISRRLASGFKTGIFFTRTNVSADLFGEGSFDKGFYFQIPIDLFLNDYRGGYINFKLRPLTRDGGQKLEVGNDLIGMLHNTSRAEIERNWGFFND